MNWSEIAPNGTAAWCNEWRARYRTMPFSRHQADTEAIMLGHATTDEGAYAVAYACSCDFRACMAGIDCAGSRVIEFGGWRGAIANAVLWQFGQLDGWTNYDIAPSAASYSHCHDPRYKCVVPDRFVWETPRPENGDIFTASHSIEHLTAEHLALLFAWLPDSIRWMYLCAPIPESCTDNDWKDYGGTHILEIGWEQVLAMLPGFELRASGPMFRWLERKK